MKILCDYRDLSVNTDNQIITMKYESVYNPQFLLDVDAAKNYIDGLKDAIDDLTPDRNKPNSTDTIVLIIIPDKDHIKLDTIQQPPVIVIRDEKNEEIIIPANGDGTTTITDADGNKFVVDKDGNVTQTENNKDLEDRSLASTTDKEFLFLVIGTDTLMAGDPIVLPQQDTPIRLSVGYLQSQLISKAANEALTDNAYKNALKNIVGHSTDSVHLEKTKWQFDSRTATGTTFTITPEQMHGTKKLKVDTREALHVILTEKETEKDTLILGNRIPGNEMEITLHFAEGGVLKFKPKGDDYYKDYGFDDAMIPQLQQAGDYGKKLQIAGTDYYVPWLYVLSNTEAEIKLEYTSKNPELDSLIVLETNNSSVIKFSKNVNSNVVPFDPLSTQTIKLYTDGDTKKRIEIVKAYSLQKGNIKTLIGQLNIESKKLSVPKTVQIIRVRRSDETEYTSFSDEQKTNLINQVNEYYKQAFIQFQLDNTKYSDTLTIKKSSKDQINQPKRDVYDLLKGRKSDKYYVFICSPGEKNNEAGKGGIVANYIILFKPGLATPTHELGHNLGLQHTFPPEEDEVNYDKKEGVCPVSNKYIEKLTTKNIMDYIYNNAPDPRRYFFKYQIEHLKNK